MKNSIVGIDIGGSKIRTILWNEKKILSAKEVKTPKNLNLFKKELFNLVSAFKQFRGVGIGVPGVSRKTTFVEAANIAYIKNVDFKDIFKDIRIKIGHDARCFALAENKAGKKNILFIILGTGVGRAVSKNGRILNIKKFADPDPWEKKYQKIRNGKNDNLLAKFLAEKFESYIKTYKPDLIIIGGGVLERKGFLEKLRKAFKIPVQKSKFGKNSAAIGAAKMLEAA